MKRSLFVICFALSCFSASAKAQVSSTTNLISCEPFSGLQAKCKVQSGISLHGPTDMEKDFYLSYRMTCDRNYAGPVLSKIRVVHGNGSVHYLNYNDAQSNIFIGSSNGNLSLEDEKPAELAGRKFSECSLYITGIVSQLSEQSIDTIQATAYGKIDVATSVIDQIEALNGVQVWYDLYISGELSETGLQQIIALLEARGDPISRQQALVLKKVIEEGEAMNLTSELDGLYGQLISIKAELNGLKLILENESSVGTDLIQTAIGRIDQALGS